MNKSFAAYVAANLRSEQFTYVDIGCSGGIDPAWRIFGSRLRALAFDASLEECERLTRNETNPEVRYVGGYVGLRADHPFAQAAAGKPTYIRSSFSRTSAASVYYRRQEHLKKASLTEKLEYNAWKLTKLGDPTKPIVAPELLAELGWTDVDLLKIDIDGDDFHVLHSFDGEFAALNILAARLEVNLCGGTGPTEHVFHNTDRFMRDQGYELLGLDVRNYSMAALPSPFAITMPAQTVTGRPFQAEAFYARDPAGPDWRHLASTMSSEKLGKLAAVFSVWGQPDSAAEILLAFRDRLAGLLDVSVGLELLAKEAQAGCDKAKSYADYISAFEADAAYFYPRSK